MSLSDMSEKGLELLIVRSPTGLSDAHILKPALGVAETPAGYAGAGYLLGSSSDYDRDHAVDMRHLFQFLQATQPKSFEALGRVVDAARGCERLTAVDGPKRLQFLNRLQGEIARRGIVDVLRKGVSDRSEHVTLF